MGAILTRVGVALVQFNLTIGTDVSVSTFARIAPFSSVSASSTITTRLVISAVVQI